MDNTNITDVAKQTIDHIINGVHQIANSISKIAPDSWKILVRQQYIDGITGLIEGFLTLFVFGMIGYFVLLIAKKSSNEDNEIKITKFIISIIWIVILLIVIYCCAESVEKILNPEYFAAIEILNKVK